MIRGETIPLKFEVDTDLTSVSILLITFEQNETIIVQKKADEIHIGSNELSVPLTQEESLKFQKGVVYAQCHYIDSDGNRRESEKEKFYVKETQLNEVIS